VSTRDAYRTIDYRAVGRAREKTAAMREALEKNDRRAVMGAMHNDFEHTVFRQYPELEKIKRRLLELGCEGVAMSGSGSTVIGVPATNVKPEEVAGALAYRTMIVQSLAGKVMDQ
jgi:4-diphosphocytidyl-2-C-methyl-D-erythritol kinase